MNIEAVTSDMTVACSSWLRLVDGAAQTANVASEWNISLDTPMGFRNIDFVVRYQDSTEMPFWQRAFPGA
jgi:hypothetical protein